MSLVVLGSSPSTSKIPMNLCCPLHFSCWKNILLGASLSHFQDAPHLIYAPSLRWVSMSKISFCTAVINDLMFIKASSVLGKPSFKKNRNFMKNFHKMGAPPPPYCICEILIQIFYSKFRDKIKMRQNSVNHSKFRFSTRLMQGITLLHYYQTHQGILFWPKTCHFELLNF